MSNNPQLPQSEGMYKLLLAASPDPIAIYNMDGDAVYINHAFETTFGWSSDELVGKRIDFVPEANKKETVQAIEQVFGEVGRVQAMDTRRYTKDGRVIDVQLSASRFADEDGEPAGIIVILRDMTSYKKAEAARLHSEERYHLILENIEDGYYEVDMQGNFTFGNDALSDALGWAKEKLIGGNYMMIMDEEMGKIVYDAFHRVYRTGAPNNGEDWRITAEDGTIRYINSSIALMKNPQGKPIGCRGIVRDTTEQRRAEEELRASEERYRIIVESIQDGYYEIDLTGRHTYINASVAAIFGYSIEDLQEFTFRKYTTKETADDLYAVYHQVYTTGEPIRDYEYPAIKKNGEDIRIHISISLITNASGEGIGFRGLVNDVTARTNAKMTLQQAHDKLEERIEERTLELLELNASLTEEIVDRTNIETELARRNKILESLSLLAREASFEMDLQPILDTVVQFTGEAVDATSVYLSTWEQERGTTAVLAEYIGPEASEKERVSDLGITYALGDDFATTAQWLDKQQEYHVSHVDDPDLTDGERAHFEEYGCQSALIVPLIAKGEPIGLLEIWESRRKRAFTEDEIELAIGIGRQISTTFDNARLYQQALDEIEERQRAEDKIKQSHEVEEVLNVLLQLSMEEMTLDELLEKAFEIIIGVSWFDALPTGSIFLVGDEPDVLLLKAKRHLDKSLQTICSRVPFGTCLCGRAAATGQMVFADSIDHRHETTFDGITEHGHYVTPILADDKVIGVLNLYLAPEHEKTERETIYLSAVTRILSGLIRQKQAEEALKSSEEKFRQLFEQSADAILLLDDGFFIDCNLATVEMMRAADKEDFLSVHPAQLSPPVQPDGRDSGEKANEMIAIAFAEGTHQFEWVRRRMDGEDFPVEVTMTVVPLEGREVLYTIWRDITERKRASDSLRDSEANARRFQDRLQTLQQVSMNLARAETLDVLYEQAVVMGREQLGFDRFGLLLYDAQAHEYIGTTGTNEQGEIVDESAIRGAVTEPMQQVIDGDKRPLLIEDTDLKYADDTVGHGWAMLTGIWDGDSLLGWLAVDNLLSQRPAASYELDLLSLYGISLGNMIAQKRAEQEVQASLDWRGRQMKIATTTAQEIAGASTLTELYDLVVTLVKERFGFYHTQLFLYDPARERATLVSSYGDAGRKLLAERHGLRLGVGLVGTAVVTKRSVLRPDVSVDATWRSNPHLPDTKGELASPIILRGEILGVLDVQTDVVDVLTADDELILEGLCGQIATAIDSIKLAHETEMRLDELNTLQQSHSREGWQAQVDKFGTIGYQFDHTGLQAYTIIDPEGTAVLNDTTTTETAVLPPVTADLVVRGQRFGILGIEEDPRQPLTDAERELLHQISEQVSEALEAARLFEQTQESLAEQERLTAELGTVAEVSTAAATILEADKLLQVVVDLAKDSFDLYHAHVYLVDDESEQLVLKAGSGTVGRLMVLEGREIRIDSRALIAQVARSKDAIIENRVSDVTNFLPHPLLPDTKSEMAVPLIVGDTLIGVLDLQSDQEGFFTDEDVQIQRTLSSQIAVSVQNARLYAEQVAAAKKLRQVDQLKSEFLASMSHELRTPLNSIIGFSDILLEGLDGELTERMDEDIRLIRGSGIHLRDLIGEILDMSKIEAGRMDLRYEEIDVVQMVGDIVATAKPLSDEKSLYLDLYIAPEVEYVEADRMRFRQIFYNIVSNAIKFTEKGGVTVDVRMNDQNFLIVSVQDTGIGIKPENVHVVFEQFRQIDGSLNRVAGGTGLGMPITKNLVELHGGQIWVESTYGFGSTFLFTIPRHRVRQKSETGMLPNL